MVTLAQIRAEGVEEVGTVYRFPYVRTPKRLVLFRGEESVQKLRDITGALPYIQVLRDQGYRVHEVSGMVGFPEDEIIARTHNVPKEFKPRPT